MSEEWIPLAEIPFKRWSKPIAINKYEFVIAPYHNPQLYEWMNADGIYKYNVNQNEWKLFVKYPSTLITSYHTLSYAHHQKKLYLYGKECTLIIIDIITHTFNIFCLNNPLWNIGYNPSSIIFGNKFHITGGSMSHKHLVLNEENLHIDTSNKPAFTIIEHIFDPYRISFYNGKKLPEGNGNKLHGLIFIKSQNILLAFGGNCGGKPMTLMWKYDCFKANEISPWNIVPKVVLPKHINGYVVT
eukprot:407858_1